MKEITFENDSLFDKKPKKSIKLKLKSIQNNDYHVSIDYVKDKLYINALSNDDFSNKKQYEKSYSIEEVRKNKYFNLLDKIEDEDDVYDVYDELDTFVKQHDTNIIKLLEKENKLIIIFPLDSLKECQFELIESQEKKLENIWNKINEIEEKTKKNDEENSSIKMQINELIKENNHLREEIIKKEIKIQSGEYLFDFWGIESHYMYYQTGDRSAIKHINFDNYYENIPKVMVSLSGLDTEKKENIRIKVHAENIDIYGFDLRIETWDVSGIYRVKASWISYGL